MVKLELNSPAFGNRISPQSLSHLPCGKELCSQTLNENGGRRGVWGVSTKNGRMFVRKMGGKMGKNVENKRKKRWVNRG